MLQYNFFNAKSKRWHFGSSYVGHFIQIPHFIMVLLPSYYHPITIHNYIPPFHINLDFQQSKPFYVYSINMMLTNINKCLKPSQCKQKKVLLLIAPVLDQQQR